MKFLSLKAFLEVKLVSIRGSDLGAIPVEIEFLKSLTTLNVPGNNIETIQKYAFVKNNRLVNLDLNDNDISKIEDYGFVGLNLLKELSIINQNLSELFYFPFNGLTSLEKVDLRNNMINTVKSSWFLDCVT